MCGSPGLHSYSATLGSPWKSRTQVLVHHSFIVHRLGRRITMQEHRSFDPMTASGPCVPRYIPTVLLSPRVPRRP